jgi:hypothetical protein
MTIVFDSLLPESLYSFINGLFSSLAKLTPTPLQKVCTAEPADSTSDK